jgi:hypothetical protein
MRAGYCAVGLLVTFACANAEENHPSKTLAILYNFEQPYSQSALKDTERELKALIGDTVKLEWHDRTDFEGRSTFSTIVVLKFLGNCDPRSDGSFRGSKDSWLARMRVFEGVVLPFGDVNCDRVRSLVSDGALGARPSDKGFGRALARVLAHELYHFLTQSTEHAAQGLEKPAFSRSDLVLDSLHLDRQQLGRLSHSMLLR